MTREYSKVHTKLEINIEFYTLLLLLDKTVCMTECLFMKEVRYQELRACRCSMTV
jgi:hypothetical protein